MERKLLQPLDRNNPELEMEPHSRLKERYEFSNDVDWIVYQAKVFYEGFGDSAKAVQLLEEGLQSHQRNPDLMFCLAECHSRQAGTLGDALKWCNKGLSLDQQSDYGYTIRARVELAMGKPIDAYCSAMAALKINHVNVEAGVILGRVGFAIAEAEGNVEEMKLSIRNLETTQSIATESQVVTQILEECECRLRKYESRR